jgi:hypothetical protein
LPPRSQMSSNPIQVILLLAIATSQIFGGISCCCLGRSILLHSSNPPKDVAEVPLLASQLQGRVACPKCASSPMRESVKSPRTQVHVAGDRTQLCGDGQCRCVKQVSTANTQNESAAVQPIGCSLVGIVAWDISRCVIQAPVHKFEVPVRFGGHSWQSIACVWKN